jgi:tRNA (cytidine/uridine-2'-O-)-methyltransferase
MPTPHRSSESLYQPGQHIVLHQPEIPGNTGAVGRTCLALHAKLWLVRPLGFRIDERSLRRAGLDYWDHLVWEVVDDWAGLLLRAGQTAASQAAGDPSAPRFWMFTRTARRLYSDARFAAGDWLVFGSETSGLPPTLLADDGRNLRIPVSPGVRSLNLSSAVAVAGYEHARQTGFF